MNAQENVPRLNMVCRKAMSTEYKTCRKALPTENKACRKTVSTVKQERGGIVMKKKYKLDEIDCANCALKLENAISEVDGVSSVKVNYMMQKLTLEADEGVFDKVEKEALAVCKRMEPDMDVSAI